MTRVTSALAALLAVAITALTLAQSRDAALAPRPAGTASLTGRVMRDASRPVARAAVTISASESGAEYQTATDDDGQFLFEKLPPGRFLVTASKMGWVTSYYGSPRPGYPPGVRVALEDGARVSIEIPMMFGSVIAGRIVHEDGRPMRQFPRLLESRMVGNRRMLARARMPYDVGNFERSTSDRGEFRFFGLPPGTYYLLVTPSMPAGARLTTDAEVRWAVDPPGVGRSAPAAPPHGSVAGYAPVYFPGTTDPARAQPIVVGPGEAREDLTLRVGFVPVARVTGAARRSDGTPAASSSVTMRHREMKASLEGSDRTASTDAAGRFTFQNVPPGDYRLTMRAASATPSRLDLWGQADVVVTGSDIEGVTLALGPASTISGRILFKGSRPSPENLGSIRLQFIATEAMATAMSGAGMSRQPIAATVLPDGTFRAEGLPPDGYLVGASWPGMREGDGTSGWWITSIRVGARDLGDAPIDVAPNADVGDVTITFGDRIGVIEGVLTDSEGRPAPEYFVLAFPVERSSWTTVSRRMVPPVRPATDGRFRIAGLPEGEYYLAVVTTMDPDAGTDPEFLESILPGAIKIAVAEGETKRQDLRIGR